MENCSEVKLAETHVSSSFNFLKNFHTVYFNGRKFFHKLYSCQHFLSFGFFGNNKNPRHKLTSHCGFGFYFLMISDTELSFTYLLAICMSSAEKCLFGTLPILKLNYLFLCCWVLEVTYILNTNLLADTFATLFSLSISYLFFYWLCPLLCRSSLIDVISLV